MDYQIPPTPIELEFLTTESRLPIPLNIFDDAVLEGPENFILFLTIPTNPVQGYGLGRISSTTITILDNDGNFQLEESRIRVALQFEESPKNSGSNNPGGQKINGSNNN